VLICASLASELASTPAATRRNSASAFAPNQPKIIAHRGGAKETTENTIEGFKRASRIGAAGIETDIRLTRDGVVVVYHDDHFGRVEGLAEPLRTKLVSDLTYAELTKQSLVPVGDDPGGRHVPRLEDLLRDVNTGLLNIELKRCEHFDELVSKTISLLKNFADLDRIILEAPDLRTAARLREALGGRLKLHINPGYDESVPFSKSLERVLEFKPHSISVSYRKMSMDVSEAAHKHGVEVWVWTVDSPDIARAMATLGADAIKTDRPTLLLNLFRSSH